MSAEPKWLGDCLLNFFVESDEQWHICEVQISLSRVEVGRDNLGGHDSYKYVCEMKCYPVLECNFSLLFCCCTTCIYYFYFLIVCYIHGYIVDTLTRCLCVPGNHSWVRTMKKLLQVAESRTLSAVAVAVAAKASELHIADTDNSMLRSSALNANAEQEIGHSLDHSYGQMKSHGDINNLVNELDTHPTKIHEEMKEEGQAPANHIVDVNIGI